MTKSPFRYFKTSPEIIQLAVMMYVDFRCPCAMSKTCSTSAVSTFAMKRSATGSIGSVLTSRTRSASGDRKNEASPQWQWHLDEVFVKIRGQTHYLWRAVDHEGEVLESFVTKTRDKASALKFLKKAMKRYGNPNVVVTDKCPSYRAAMKMIGSEGARRLAGTSTIALRIHTCHFEDESGLCPVSGACEVSRNSLQSIRLYTTTSIIKGISRAGPGSNRYATPLFSNGAS
jgi:transposase-like protein